MATTHSIIICTNRRYGINSPSCAASGSEELADALEQQLTEKELDIPVKRIMCLGQCERGPNCRIAPGGRFYHQLAIDDLPGVIAELQRLELDK